jgi:putative endonuclease
MFYVYVLRSKTDCMLYTGYTGDLKSRVAAHNAGKVASTKARIPFELVYYEACRHQNDALHRERYLKSTYGHRYLRNRLKHDAP